MAIIDLIRDCIFLIHFDLMYSFLLLLFYSIICTPLSTVAFQGSYQCYHYVIQLRTFSKIYRSPVRVTIHPDESLLSVGWNVVSFSKFYNSWGKTFIVFTAYLTVTNKKQQDRDLGWMKVPHWLRVIWKTYSGILFHTLYLAITKSQRHKKRVLIVIHFNPSRSFFYTDLFSDIVKKRALNWNQNTVPI